jgi:hypothetical protein
VPSYGRPADDELKRPTHETFRGFCRPERASTIFPLLDLDWQSQIDQSCLEERQREHVARVDMERIIERIAAALLELEMRAVAPAAEVWAKVDPFDHPGRGYLHFRGKNNRMINSAFENKRAFTPVSALHTTTSFGSDFIRQVAKDIARFKTDGDIMKGHIQQRDAAFRKRYQAALDAPPDQDLRYVFKPIMIGRH